MNEISHIREHAHALGVAAPAVQRRPGPGDADGLSGLYWETQPRFVFLHGASLDAHTWDGVLLRLGEAAVAYDLPGHGHSLHLAPGDYSISHMAGLIAEAVHRDLQQKFTLVGHSLGALVSMALAARHGLPVNRLVLLDATPHGLGGSVNDPKVRHVGTLDELVDAIHVRVPDRDRKSLFRGVSRNVRERSDGLLEWRWDPRFRDSAAVRGAEKTQVWDALASLDIPITLIRGDRSRLVTDEMIEDFLRYAPHATVEIAPKSGHNVHTDAAAWVAEWLAAVPSSPTD
jgi:pimeloyl-ACP methyl ester carboxylesterase